MGVVFSALPPAVGGGVRERVLEPGEKEFIFPWESLYRINTTVRSLTWGAEGIGDNKEHEDYIETRALDGNEVGLAVTVQYRIDPKMVHHVLKRVGLDNVSTFVATAARADIRTHLNTLETSGFINAFRRNTAFDNVEQALNYRLNREGILVEQVIYTDHRFERKRRDGTTDAAYQDQIDLTQVTEQEYQAEPKRRDAEAEKKMKELQEAQGRVNQLIEAAKGYERAATARGDAYLERRKNNAQEILEKGLNEVEGMTEQVKALSGPGGKAILRMAIADEILKRNPRYVVLQGAGEGDGNQIGVNRVDTNELIEQVGLFAAAKEALDDKKLSSPAQERPGEISSK